MQSQNENPRTDNRAPALHNANFRNTYDHAPFLHPTPTPTPAESPLLPVLSSPRCRGQRNCTLPKFQRTSLRDCICGGRAILENPGTFSSRDISAMSHGPNGYCRWQPSSLLVGNGEVQVVRGQARQWWRSVFGGRTLRVRIHRRGCP